METLVSQSFSALFANMILRAFGLRFIQRCLARPIARMAGMWYTGGRHRARRI
jgi:hypothetical protein